MSNHIKILFLLLLAYSITLMHARPSDELAARLSLLYLDPANDERFNDIEHFDDGEVHYSKRKDVVDEVAFLRIINASTNKPDEGEELTESAEAEKRLTRSMVSSIFSFMGNMMRRFIPR
ncbi:uncharacterized protein LOC105211155 [Zeugodacus cucurbitae]|uniref:uncharacterized protein LOC105211155 n=1 Tax=Zeugodacus cucurbitae TaxID=28588 RepID=UPI000596A68D|nr:uncharacterized protein LOC105211155 [Zeugodacus cucurbitae]